MKSHAAINKLYLFAATCFATFGPVHAAAVNITHWTLSDVTFIDGGTASGTFSIDSDTAEPTDFDIMTTTGSVYTGVNYSPLNSSHGKEPYGQNSFYFFNSGSNRIINFAFRIPLSNSASTVDLDDETSYESITNGPNRSVVGGSAVSMSAIPEPETYALLLAGLGASGFIARRRKSL